MTALALSRSGIASTIVERDVIQQAPDVESAFSADRRGTPQSRHTHGFLARLLVLLRERFPDVLQELEDAGSFTLSMTGHLGEPRPGDEDLAALIVRRSTFEWVLRQRVQAATNVKIRTGVGIQGLTSHRSDGSGRPIISGVRLDDGTTINAHTVIATTGARGDVVGWLADLGVNCAERVRPSDITYLTRWYRRPVIQGEEPRLFSHMPYVKVLAVPGDGDTLSVTLAVRLGDTELRRALATPQSFDHACRLMPATEHIFAPGAPPVQPLSDVHLMAGLLNRTRQFADQAGFPLVIGFHAVGDVHTTTNPLLGRGCTLAAIQAVLLADAFVDHPNDPVPRAVAYETSSGQMVFPWCENGMIMDALENGRSVSEFNEDAVDAARLIGAMFIYGSDDPTVGRALARYINLLDLPAHLLSQEGLVARVAELAELHGTQIGAPLQGPTREELLAQLHSVR